MKPMRNFIKIARPVHLRRGTSKRDLLFEQRGPNGSTLSYRSGKTIPVCIYGNPADSIYTCYAGRPHPRGPNKLEQRLLSKATLSTCTRLPKVGSNPIGHRLCGPGPEIAESRPLLCVLATTTVAGTSRESRGRRIVTRSRKHRSYRALKASTNSTSQLAVRLASWKRLGILLFSSMRHG
jgi:hypothetical protein